MMRALLVVLCLLLSIVPASTEGAWVLWNVSTEKPRTAYVDGAKLTAQQQRAAERDFIQAERGPSSQAERPERPRSLELHLTPCHGRPAGAREQEIKSDGGRGRAGQGASRKRHR